MKYGPFAGIEIVQKLSKTQNSIRYSLKLYNPRASYNNLFVTIVWSTRKRINQEQSPSNISSSNFTRAYSPFKRLFFKCLQLKEFGTKLLSKKVEFRTIKRRMLTFYIKTLNEKPSIIGNMSFYPTTYKVCQINILVISI